MSSDLATRRQQRQWERSALTAFQIGKLNDLLAHLLPNNRFYARKLAGRRTLLAAIEDLKDWPFTTKEELALDRVEARPASTSNPHISTSDPPPRLGAANLTYPLEKYVRFHQTSGTRGDPLTVLDTAEDWQWWIECWQHVLDAAGIQPGDRALIASSFGPFIAWWTAQDALLARGAMVIPGGGMSSLARIDLMRRAAATALFCTPTYALRLAEVAGENGIDLRELGVRRVVVAGEPGGSIQSIRERIEMAFGAIVYDHAGATEVGPWGFAAADRSGLHVIETEFVAESIDLQTGLSAREGDVGELVLTSLGRLGAPVIRYRTGDLVRASHPAEGPCRFALLTGGVLGRVDDMMIIRGVNIFPSSIEAILHRFPEVQEYRLTAKRCGEVDIVEVDVEDHLAQPGRIANELKLRLGLKIDVRCVPAGSLPRFEGKAHRFVDERNANKC